MENVIIEPAPFAKALEPAEIGPVFEIRIYTFQPGALPHVIEGWKDSLPAREKYSPNVFTGYTEIGGLNRWYHVWAYPSLAERDRVRADDELGLTLSGLLPPASTGSARRTRYLTRRHSRPYGRGDRPVAQPERLLIYEMRTETLRPGAVPEYERRFGEKLPSRERHSKLGAFWHTVIGPLNQVIHVWPYEDLAHRAKVRAEAAHEPGWPPQVG